MIFDHKACIKSGSRRTYMFDISLTYFSPYCNLLSKGGIPPILTGQKSLTIENSQVCFHLDNFYLVFILQAVLDPHFLTFYVILTPK